MSDLQRWVAFYRAQMLKELQAQVEESRGLPEAQPAPPPSNPPIGGPFGPPK